MKTITNKDLMRRANSKLVLQEIFNNDYTTRAEISRHLGLNKSTVSSIYDELKEEQLVEEVGEGAASHVGGRKPTNIRIYASYGFTINFDISYHNLHFMANYLDGSVIAQAETTIHQKNIHEILAIIEHQIDQYVDTVVSVKGLLGICLSIHGIVNEQQEITYSPFIDFEDVNLNERLSAKYHVPVVLENESNLAAVYVRDFMLKFDSKNLVAIGIHKGIGSGVIINNRLFRGFRGQAGEVGRTLTKNAQGQLTPIEQICSEDAIINRISDELGLTGLNRYKVVEMYREHNHNVVAAIDEFIQEISSLIYNSSMYFDTDAIYLGSPLMEAAPEIFDQVLAKVHQLSQNKIDLVRLPNSDKATLLGACSVITHYVLKLRDYQLTFLEEKSNFTT